MALVNLALLILALALLWRCWNLASDTGSVVQLWMASALILANCYYLVQFIVSLVS